jgi:uncharacterized protein (TIGR03435 family)
MTKGHVLIVSVILIFSSKAQLLDRTSGATSFEVVSIKPIANGAVAPKWVVTPGRLNYSNAGLKNLILRAYGISGYQLLDPAKFLEGEGRWDIVATMPPETSPENVLLMLQSVLADRFKLRVHRSTEERLMDVLTVDKSGLRAHPAVTTSGLSVTRTESGKLHIKGEVSFAALAGFLSGYLSRIVIDRTDRPGRFGIDLEWTPGEGEHGYKASSTGSADLFGPPSDSNNSITTALQEVLGVKFARQRCSIETVIIDNVEKMPTEN